MLTWNGDQDQQSRDEAAGALQCVHSLDEVWIRVELQRSAPEAVVCKGKRMNALKVASLPQDNSPSSGCCLLQHLCSLEWIWTEVSAVNRIAYQQTHGRS